MIYEKTVNFFANNKLPRKILGLVYKWLPLLIFVSYPLMIVYVFFQRQGDIFKVVLVPFGVFVLVTVLRKIIKKERPYEKYGIPSVFNKTTKGQSMPSRHTASAFVIAMTFLYVNPVLGIIALCIATLICISRLLAGVHFISDLIVGLAISIASGIIFLFII